MSVSTTLHSRAPRTPRWWNHGSALRTRLFDGLSLLLPTAEQFLLDTTRDWLDSPDVAAEERVRWQAPLKAFMHDECAHQRAHQRDRQRLSAEGVPVDALTQGVDRAVAELQHLPLAQRLSLGAAFEELTALWSFEILHQRVWLDRTPNTQTRLWRWHCQEELDHHAVLPDIQQAQGISRRTRLSALLMATACLAWDTLSLWRGLCAHDLRCGRSTRTELLWQSIPLAIQATPSCLRMGWGWLKLLARTLR